MEQPLVSIVCEVYNHEPFLRDCLDGFVMQKTTFPFEILIHDDASTDHSADIIREYEEKYPELFEPIYQKENQCSKRVHIWAQIQFPRARGKYIAICEGDDFWTDPLKLQKQVDYLESHPDCTLCFTNAIMRWEDGSGRPDRLFAPKLEERDYRGPDLTVDWMTPTASLVFRKSVVDSSFYEHVWKHPKVGLAGDIPLVLTCCRFGAAHALNDATCVYRRQPNGFMLSADSNKRILCGDHKLALYRVFGKEYLESSVIKSLYYYRHGLWDAKNERNISNYFKILGRILYVYFRHPICAGKRILKILKERQERVSNPVS